MPFAATAQEKVFTDLSTGEQFEHDEKHPSSLALLDEISQGKPVIPYVPPTYSDHRRNVYRQAFSGDDFQEAFFEWIAGRPARADALQARRAEIKARFPKPKQ
ncbi:MAG: hypothetical protein WC378_14200 [Opitutaceae bacterium]|jgi:hypothetical protein